VVSENLVSIRVWGDFACFTRPEMKVERVSYPVMTPSAARGILEAIFWEPQMHYWIDSIRILKKGRWVSFRRNEVMEQISIRNAQQWMGDPSRFQPIQAGGGAPDGTPRNMLALEDVEYIISAETRLTEIGQRAGESVAKYRDELSRRARQGKCFHRPGLGMREFAANFDYEPDPDEGMERRAAELGLKADWRMTWPDEDLGLVLYDVFDHLERGAGFRWLTDAEAEAGRGQSRRGAATTRHEGVAVRPSAAFFRARVRDSTLDCHPGRVDIIARKTGGESDAAAEIS